MQSSVKSLCFREVYDLRRKGNIGLEEYLTNIVAHYKGVQHATDGEGKRPWLPSGFEDEVREFVLGEDYRPLNDADSLTLYTIFWNAFQGNISALRTQLDPYTAASEYYLRPLVQIALIEGNAQLLRLCYEEGYLPTDYFGLLHLLSRRCDHNPSTAWLDVLYEHDYRQWRTDPQQLGQTHTWRYISWMGPDCIRWWLNHGGHVSKARGLFEFAGRGRWPGHASIRVLLDHFGIEWFENSGTLQFAVQARDLDTVRMMVEAGADVNERVEDWQTDIREHPLGPLPALQTALYAKEEEALRYLVEHGATVPRKDIEHSYMPSEFVPFRDLIVKLGGVDKFDGQP